MQTNIGIQFLSFIFFVALGIFSAIIFTLLNKQLNKAKSKIKNDKKFLVLTFFVDVLYCLLIGIAFLTSNIILNFGAIRWYILFGFALGPILCFYFSFYKLFKIR